MVKHLFIGSSVKFVISGDHSMFPLEQFHLWENVFLSSAKEKEKLALAVVMVNFWMTRKSNFEDYLINIYVKFGSNGVCCLGEIDIGV